MRLKISSKAQHHRFLAVSNRGWLLQGLWLLSQTLSCFMSPQVLWIRRQQ